MQPQAAWDTSGLLGMMGKDHSVITMCLIWMRELKMVVSHIHTHLTHRRDETNGASQHKFLICGQSFFFFFY